MLRCQNHELCSSTRLDLELPKRILDISAPDGTILLRETDAEKAPYVTLSYRWGDGLPLRTTHSTIAQHYAGIPLASFPATLKDVIILAKALGFQYIWIDALCIIQDDSLDWQEQSAAMTAIYHGCSLNIAIADAPNCNSGILETIQDGYNTPYSSVLRYFEHRNSLLEARGWVFQETLVSVASLYITDNRLVWDCCSVVCAQGGESSAARLWAHPTDSMTPKAIWADQKLISRLDSSPTKNLDVLRIWYEWVVMFSHRDLSNVNDKLPAMAGLASRLQAVSSATYAAGLWEEDIHVGLIWSAKKSEGLMRPGNGAPSWSWASVEGHLDYL
ncbi:heterokaryon incompatibility protein-domain-containing protein, partial [Cladorrhinum sp. PSN259]